MRARAVVNHKITFVMNSVDNTADSVASQSYIDELDLYMNGIGSLDRQINSLITMCTDVGDESEGDGEAESDPAALPDDFSRDFDSQSEYSLRIKTCLNEYRRHVAGQPEVTSTCARSCSIDIIKLPLISCDTLCGTSSSSIEYHSFISQLMHIRVTVLM